MRIQANRFTNSPLSPGQAERGQDALDLEKFLAEKPISKCSFFSKAADYGLMVWYGKKATGGRNAKIPSEMKCETERESDYIWADRIEMSHLNFLLINKGFLRDRIRPKWHFGAITVSVVSPGCPT